jgi:hypothetical protein
VCPGVLCQSSEGHQREASAAISRLRVLQGGLGEAVSISVSLTIQDVTIVEPNSLIQPDN